MEAFMAKSQIGHECGQALYPQNETPFREGGFVRLGRSEENPRPWFLMAKGNSVELASDLTSLLPSLLPSPVFPATAVCHHHREE